MTSPPSPSRSSRRSTSCATGSSGRSSTRTAAGTPCRPTGQPGARRRSSGRALRIARVDDDFARLAGRMSIEVANESGFEVDETRLVALSRFVLDQMRIHPLAELSLLLVDVEAMSQLHVQWMDEEGPTDVLAFPMDELRPGKEDVPLEPGLLGDVVLCPVVAETQAAAAGHSTAAELEMLTTHGILHLLGYDHAETEEREEMFRLQGELLAAWALPKDRQGS